MSRALQDTSTMILAFVVLWHPGGYEEHMSPGGVTMVRMFGAAQVMMGKYYFMSGKSFHGVRSVKMFLHQLYGAEGVKQCAGPQYIHRRTILCVFGTIIIAVM